jgi:PAS domain S-box-containing protein
MPRPPNDIQLLLSAIVSSSNDAIIGKDLNGIVTSWNPAAERIFGYTAKEAIGQSIRLIIPPELQPEEDEVLRKVRAGEGLHHFETARLAKDGRRLDISLTVSPIRAPDGTVIGASKIARDVTLTKQLERDALTTAIVVGGKSVIRIDEKRL